MAEAKQGSKKRPPQKGSKKQGSKKGSPQSREQQKRQKTIATIIVVIVVLVFVGLWIYDYFYGEEGVPPYAYGEGDAVVHFLDVGQGDCAIIEFPDQKKMIIDAGTTAQSSKIKSYMNSLDIEHFEVVFLTHTDADHCGGFAGNAKDSPSGVLTTAGLTYDKVYMPKIKSRVSNDPLIGNTARIETNSYDNFVSTVVGSGTEIVYTAAEGNSDEGVVIEGEGYSVKIFAPVTDAVYNGVGENSGGAAKNKVSSIIMLEYNGRRVMFTGDATGDTEAAFLDYTQLLDMRVDVLKVAHHGSGTEGSNSQAFYNKVSPSFAIISVKEGSYNNMPAVEVMDRIRAGSRFVRFFRTDIEGDIVCTLTEEGEIRWWTGKDGDMGILTIKSGGFEALFVFFSQREAGAGVEAKCLTKSE